VAYAYNPRNQEEYLKFKTSLGNIATTYLKKKKAQSIKFFSSTLPIQVKILTMNAENLAKPIYVKERLGNYITSGIMYNILF
jgi:hypothetical protein